MLWKLKAIFNHFLRRFAQVLQILRFPTNFCIRVNSIHHYLVLHELLPILNDTYKCCMNKKFNIGNNSGIIWTLWWQGYSSMPPLVKECYKNLLEHSNGHEVILITKDNIKRYAYLPNYIYKKLKLKDISLTHLSDILRFNLLKNYGGLWIDSTVFCSSDLTNKYFQSFYTSRVNPDKYHFSVSLSRWTGFLIGGNKNLPLFNFMDTFFSLYWQRYNCLIDYFMIDYTLYYAYCENIGNIRPLIDNDDTQYHMFSLINLMPNKYNDNQYKKLKNDTELFKLTYKKKLKSNRGTYYNYFLNGKL